MRTTIRHWLSAILATLVLAACQDSGTFSEDVPSAAPVHRAEIRGAAQAAQEYVCYTSVSTPTGEHAYQYGRIALRFPEKAMHRGDATHRYRYRMVNGGGKVLRSANCVIPRSDEAVRMMNRRFGVPDQQGELQIQGCVSDGVCILEPIIVIGDGDSGGSAGGGGGDGDGSGDGGTGECMESVGDFSTVQGCSRGGGATPDPEDPYAWDDGTGRPKCERDAAGHCVTREVNQAEWDRLGDAIEALPENPVECRGAKNSLRTLYAQGRTSQRIRFWDGYDKPTSTTQRYGQNLADAQGRYIEYDSYHIWHFQTLLIHEGLHAWLAENPDNSGLVSGPDGLSNEDWVEQMARRCHGV